MAPIMRRLFAYGLDAPPAVITFFALGVAFWLIQFFGMPHWSPVTFTAAWWFACWMWGIAIGMCVSSAWGKLRARERLLNRLDWSGDETVLDAGCGLGLLAIGAARRIPRGRAIGVDVWRQRDLGGNGPDAMMQNARREGVADRVDVRTGDMRALDLPDGSIDRVVSRYAIHNIAGRPGRDRAIAELIRVAAPHAQMVIEDIRNLPRYAQLLGENGFSVMVNRSPADILFSLISFGGIRPGVLTARR